MEPRAYLDCLQHESSALMAAARAADPEAPVPGCPAWTVTDLVWHTGVVHDFWGHLVRHRHQTPAEYEQPARPGADRTPTDAFEEIHTFAGERAAALHRVLSDTDPTTPVWTWTDQKDVAFVLRRVAHETAVHRVDAEHASGGDHRLAPELAADGVDEFLTFFVPLASTDAPPLVGSVHLHCTDDPVPGAGGEWTVRLSAGGASVVAREHTKADTALRGTAHDLLMVLWRRAPLDVVSVFGDRAVAEAFVARARNE